MGKRDLLTVQDRDQLLVNAIAGDRDHPPVVKLFTPDANATGSSARLIRTILIACSVFAMWDRDTRN